MRSAVFQGVRNSSIIKKNGLSGDRQSKGENGMISKRKTGFSLLASLAATVCGAAVNYLYYLKNGFLLLAYRMYGGEITEEFGFGLRYTHIYTMTPGGRDSIRLRFDPLNLLITFAVLFAVVYAIVWLADRMSRKKKEG